MGLNHIMGVGADALMTTRQGIDTSGHNIANAQVEGYSRQRVNAVARQPLDRNNLLIGNGVYVENITRAHDQFLEKQINLTNQTHGAHTALSGELKGLEGIFSPELNASVSDQMGAFFNSLQVIANFPEELSSRTQLRETAKDVVSAFRRVDTNLNDAQRNLDQKIEGEAKEINGMLKQIADLNARISAEETGGSKPANDLRDEQDRLLRKLNTKMEVNYYRGNYGMLTVRGPNATLLVDMNAAASVDVAKNPDTLLNDVVVTDSSGRKSRLITQKNEGGSLQGLVEVRDKVIEDLKVKNNTLATSFANEVNAVHRRGYGLKDFKEVTGRDFFEISNDPSKAAKTIEVSGLIEMSTDAISVAATPHAPGDNVIANDLLRLKDERILENNNATFTDYYANMVSNFGLDAVRAENMRQADDIMLGDLNARRESIAGVSLDEEAMNLMKWQANFTAASKVITTVDEMYDTVLSMKR